MGGWDVKDCCAKGIEIITLATIAGASMGRRQIYLI